MRFYRRDGRHVPQRGSTWVGSQQREPPEVAALRRWDHAHLGSSLQLCDELAVLAEEGDGRPLTDAEQRRLDRAVRLCRASIREQREAREGDRV